MAMQLWWKRVRDEIDRRGWSIVEFERQTGIDRGRLYKYVVGEVSQPRGDAFARMAEALDVNEWWLRTGEGARTRKLPLLGHVAGDASVTLSDRNGEARSATGFLDFDLGAGEHFVLEVRCREMAPVYRDGDLIICRKLTAGEPIAPAGETRPRDCVVALGENQTVLRYLTPGRREGTVKLRAFNPEVADRDDVAPLWVAPVVWIRRKV